LLELSLIIPPYQRPYKWQAHNVNQLIEDVLLHRNKSRYRLGTVVLHQETENELSIVDGQQRLLTLALLYSLLDKNSIITPAKVTKTVMLKTLPPQTTYYKAFLKITLS